VSPAQRLTEANSYGRKEVDMYRNIAAMLVAVALVAAVTLPAKSFAETVAAVDTVIKPRISVKVQNGNWLDVRVYAVTESGAYDRLGTVTSFTSRTFELPRWITAPTSQIQLVAVPIGSTRSYAAQPVLVSVGDVIEWKLTNNLALSSIWVRAS
jgi:hypothetical protein